MKNLKKVLALAVAFVMCFTMFAGAAVYSDVPAGSDYSEAVTLLSDLGVIAGLPDGSFGVDKTITRADAACLIARILTGETMPSKYAGASNFVDVPKDAYYESAVAYCAIEGITSGTGNGAYSPKREITDGEFIAMLTRALGYDSAENPLAFPMGNVARAQQEGLLEGVNVVVDSPALRGEDAQMIYNALFADFDKYAKIKNIYQAADDIDSYTIAEEVFGLCRLAVKNGSDASDARFYTSDVHNARTFECVSHKWVVVGKDNNDENTYVAYEVLNKDLEVVENCEAGAITFKYTGDADSIMGYQVELWGDKDHSGDVKEVKAIKTVKGQKVYDYNPSMFDDDPDNDKIKLDGVTLLVGDEADKPAYYAALRMQDDEEFYSHVQDIDHVYGLAEATEEFLNVKNGFTYKLMDWDSDDEVDFVLVTERYYGEVIDVDSEEIDIEAQNGADYTLKVDEDDFKTVGTVEEGDIVEITVSRAHDKKEGEVITVNLETVDPESKVYNAYTVRAEEYFFDDEEDPMYWGTDGDEGNVDEGSYNGYKKWHIVDQPFEDEKFAKDDTYDLYLNENGFIIAADESDGNNGYLMILDTKNGEKWKFSSKDKLAEVEVLLENNKVEKMEVVGGLKIDKKNNGTTGYESGDYSWTDEGRLVVGKVFKYSANSDGVITKLTSAVGFDGTKTIDPSDDSFGNTTVGGRAGLGYTYRDKTRRLTIGSSLASRDEEYYTMKKDSTVFLAKPHKLNNPRFVDATTGAAVNAGPNAKVSIDTPYIQIDADKHYWVDSKDVMAISADKLPTISHPVDTNYDILNAALTNVGMYGNTFDTYLNGRPDDKGFTVLTGKPGSARNDLDVALLGIDDFDDIENNVSIALITEVKVSSKNCVISAAMNGEVTKFTTVNGAPEDIFFEVGADYSDSDEGLTEDDLTKGHEAWFDNNDDDGFYAEVYRNGDGAVTRVVFLKKNNDGIYFKDSQTTVAAYEGDYYRVIRAAVTDTSSSTLDVLMNMTFEGDKKVSAEYANLDTTYDRFKLSGSTKYYTIGNESGVPTTSGVTMRVSDGFKKNKNLFNSMKAAELKDVKISDDRVDPTRNDYYFADIAMKDNLTDVVGVWSFTKSFDGSKAVSKDLKSSSFKVDETAYNDGEAKPVAQVSSLTIPAKVETSSNSMVDFNLDGEDVSIQVNGGSGASVIADEIASGFAAAIAGTSIDGKFTAKRGTGSEGNKVLITAVNANESFELKDATLGTTSIPVAVETVASEGEKTDKKEATAIITVAAGPYTVPAAGQEIEIEFTNGSEANKKVTVSLSAGTYTSENLAKEIATEVDKKANLEATFETGSSDVTVTEKGTISDGDELGIKITVK